MIGVNRKVILDYVMCLGSFSRVKLLFDFCPFRVEGEETADTGVLGSVPTVEFLLREPHKHPDSCETQRHFVVSK